MPSVYTSVSSAADSKHLKAWDLLLVTSVSFPRSRQCLTCLMNRTGYFSPRPLFGGISHITDGVRWEETPSKTNKIRLSPPPSGGLEHSPEGDWGDSPLLWSLAGLRRKGGLTGRGSLSTVLHVHLGIGSEKGQALGTGALRWWQRGRRALPRGGGRETDKGPPREGAASRASRLLQRGGYARSLSLMTAPGPQSPTS